MFALHGKPAFLRADNGREFIAASLVEWLEDQGVKVVFIAKASPWQNGINERFNGTMERELFGHEVYHSILEIQYVVDAWTEKYNTMRVHRALAGQTPAAYAKMLQQAGPADQVVVAIERHYHHTTWTSQNPGRRLHHTTRPDQHPSQALDQKDGAGQWVQRPRRRHSHMPDWCASWLDLALADTASTT